MPGETIEIQTAGGGGYGEPAVRAIDAVERDRLDEIASL
jgi:N-methylhydantoinase B/oxoprolinase/acetone carboxylase alpha subunit